MRNVWIFIMPILISLLLISCNGERKQSDYLDNTVKSIPITESKKMKNVPDSQTASFGYAVAGKDTFLLDEGMKFIIVKKGDGKKVANGKSVTVNYTGYLTDGKKFDSSFDRNEPFTFVLGTGAVIKGWDIGILEMNIGSKARLLIPSELGYGEGGYPPKIPPGANLIFDVEVMNAE